MLQELKKLLENKNIRVTAFRLAVSEVLFKAKNALSIHQIEAALGEYDRITLYRTIKTFKEKGVIHEISLPNEDVKYALCADTCSEHQHQHEHIHIKCTICEKIFCQEITDFPQLKVKGFQLNKIEINAFGVCPECG